jgi:hypothetical protein
MGLTKHLARSRCLVADNLLFAAIAIICKCCVADDANLSALGEGFCLGSIAAGGTSGRPFASCGQGGS